MRRTDASKLDLVSLEALFNRLTTTSRHGHIAGYYRHHSRFNYSQLIFIEYLNTKYSLGILLEDTNYVCPCTTLEWNYSSVSSKLRDIAFKDIETGFTEYYKKEEERTFTFVSTFLTIVSVLLLISAVWYLCQL